MKNTYELANNNAPKQISGAEIYDVIRRLFNTCNNDLEKEIKTAQLTIQKEQNKRNAHSPDPQLKKGPPTHQENLATITLLLATEFIENRRNEENFDPYEFMGVKLDSQNNTDITLHHLVV